jgi:glutamate synthase domain-containing protein 3
MVESYLLLVAEEARRHLAALGLRSLQDAVGRSDLLAPRRDVDERRALLGVEGLLAPAGGGYGGVPLPVASGGELGEKVASDRPGRSYAIRNVDRAVGARLGGETARRTRRSHRERTYRFAGSAGQSFGAFLPAGVEFVLDGEANDYVGKALSGGRIVVRAPAGDAGDPGLLGNTVLYGATSGELYCAGSAGERFAVRNSGATAVVEGVGSNACEYMTNGTVAILGPFGRNLAAGMTGGEVFVHDPEDLLPLRLNVQLVRSDELDAEGGERLRLLLERHVEATGSALAAALLASWPSSATAFRLLRPKADIRRLEAQAEGTEHAEEPAARRADTPVARR